MSEHHTANRLSWLRAAVLGANDGLLSTASLMLGVATAQASIKNILLAGISGLFAGSMSMAAGEYISVSSQSDAEHADLQRETQELESDAEAEQRELAKIYVERGLEPDLAAQVSAQLTKHNALEAHARDELGIIETTMAKPFTAAMASAVSFAIGASAPLIVTVFSPREYVPYSVSGSSIVFLFILGAIAAVAGGAKPVKAAMRVVFWGAIAMAVTAGIGHLFGTNVG